MLPHTEERWRQADVVSTLIRRRSMKTVLIIPCVTGALVATAQVAWPQASSQQSGQQASPTGPSGTGVAGQPGNKSGPAAKPSNGPGMGIGAAPAGADPSGVKGLPGNKSG